MLCLATGLGRIHAILLECPWIFWNAPQAVLECPRIFGMSLKLILECPRIFWNAPQADLECPRISGTCFGIPLLLECPCFRFSKYPDIFGMSLDIFWNVPFYFSKYPDIFSKYPDIFWNVPFYFWKYPDISWKYPDILECPCFWNVLFWNAPIFTCFWNVPIFHH